MAKDVATTTPFTILVDTREQRPFTFRGMKSDANQGRRRLVVKTEWRCLGQASGDYSIDGLAGRCNVERKSIGDAQSTILGWHGRRERFKLELVTLSEMECSAVVVECTFGDLIRTAESRGVRTKAENQKTLFRQVLAWQQDYAVPWIFCDGRRLAEIATFRILERFWRKVKKEERVRVKEMQGDLF